LVSVGYAKVVWDWSNPKGKPEPEVRRFKVNKKKFLKPENCIDDWEDYPCRHNQEIMIVCISPDSKDRYLLEKISTNKYGGFSFSIENLKDLIEKVSEWEERIGLTCVLVGRCGECY